MQLFYLSLMILTILYICIGNTNNNNNIKKIFPKNKLDKSDLNKIINKKLLKNLSDEKSTNLVLDDTSLQLSDQNSLQLSEQNSLQLSESEVSSKYTNKTYIGGAIDIIDKEVADIAGKINDTKKSINDVTKTLNESHITSKTISKIEDSSILYNNLYNLLMNLNSKLKNHLFVKKEYDFWSNEKIRLLEMRDKYKAKYETFSEEQKILGKSILDDIQSDLDKVFYQLQLLFFNM